MDPSYACLRKKFGLDLRHDRQDVTIFQANPDVFRTEQTFLVAPARLPTGSESAWDPAFGLRQKAGGPAMLVRRT